MVNYYCIQDLGEVHCMLGMCSVVWFDDIIRYYHEEAWLLHGLHHFTPNVSVVCCFSLYRKPM